MQANLVTLVYHIELQPGEQLTLPEPLVATLPAGRWMITIQPLEAAPAEAPVRDHTAFLNSYAPEDEGLYDDDATR